MSDVCTVTPRPRANALMQYPESTSALLRTVGKNAVICLDRRSCVSTVSNPMMSMFPEACRSQGIEWMEERKEERERGGKLTHNLVINYKAL